jgi:hypothetical protein
MLSQNPTSTWDSASPQQSKQCHALGLRHRYHLLHQLASELNHQLALITRHNASLPEFPENQRQIYAKIYRDSQVKILASALSRIVLEFSQFLSTNPTGSSLLTLQTATTLLASSKLTAVLELLLGTADIPTLQAQGWEHETWAIWLCHVLADCKLPSDRQSGFNQWVERVRLYPSPVSSAPEQDEHLAEIIGIVESKYGADVGVEEALANRTLLGDVTPDGLRRASYLVQQEGLYLDNRILGTMPSGELEGQWVLALDPENLSR